MKSVKLRESLVALGWVIVLLLPLVLLGWYVAQRHHAALDQMAELEPRYARLSGLEMQRTEMTAALARAESARAQYLYPSTQDATQAGNTAQQKLRDIFTNAGLQVSSSQVLPPKAEKTFDRIPLTVRTEGDLLALQSALAVLSGQTPMILINEVEIQVVGAMGNVSPSVAPRLAAQFTFSVFRERS
jgi:general secretion pathway protein M